MTGFKYLKSKAQFYIQDTAFFLTKLLTVEVVTAMIYGGELQQNISPPSLSLFPLSRLLQLRLQTHPCPVLTPDQFVFEGGDI